MNRLYTFRATTALDLFSVALNTTPYAPFPSLLQISNFLGERKKHVSITLITNTTVRTHLQQTEIKEKARDRIFYMFLFRLVHRPTW